MTHAVELKTLPVADGRSDSVMLLSLDRPEAANSFNDAVIRELVQHLRTAKNNPKCRALVIRGKGKHFSAGADLAWMKASANLSLQDNARDARGLIDLFEALADVPFPTVAVVSGSAFGGAVGLAAACDIAVAAESARFCLSEIKLGIMPAVILPYLARKMRPGALRRFGLTGKLFSATEARECGLIERVVKDDELEAAVKEELNLLLQGSPEAQAALKQLIHRVTTDSLKQGSHTAEAIAVMRTSASGQAGLGAFFDKKPAPWSVTLGPSWSLDG